MAAMNQRKLVVLLNDFKENRRMSSESEAMLKPFWGMPFSFTFIFESASKTFSQKYGTQFAGGKTVVAKIIDSELMCSVLFSTGQNDWLCGLSAGQKFKKEVMLLGFDNLYDRVVFGHTLETEMVRRAAKTKADIARNENDQKEESTQESEGMKDLYSSPLQKEFIERKDCHDSTHRKPKQIVRTLKKFKEISKKVRRGRKLPLPKSGSRRRWGTFAGSTITSNQGEDNAIPSLIKNILAAVALVMFVLLVFLFY